MKIPLHKWKIFGASCIATLFSIITPYIVLSGILALLYKLVLGLLICLVAIPKREFKRLFLFYSMFMIFTLICGGVCFGTLLALDINVNINSFQLDFPMGVILLILYLFAVWLFKIISKIYNSEKNKNLVCMVTLIFQNKQIKLVGYLDTGNGLYDDQTNLPVIIINKTKICKYLDFKQKCYWELGLFEDMNLKNFHYIGFNTLNGIQSKIPVFMPDGVEIENGEIKKNINVMVGLTNQNFDTNKKYGVLLHPAVV